MRWRWPSPAPALNCEPAAVRFMDGVAVCGEGAPPNGTQALALGLKLDLNSASEEELARVPGVGRSLAASSWRPGRPRVVSPAGTRWMPSPAWEVPSWRPSRQPPSYERRRPPAPCGKHGACKSPAPSARCSTTSTPGCCHRREPRCSARAAAASSPRCPRVRCSPRPRGRGEPPLGTPAVGTSTQVFGSPYAASGKPPGSSTTQVFGAVPVPGAPGAPPPSERTPRSARRGAALVVRQDAELRLGRDCASLGQGTPTSAPRPFAPARWRARLCPPPGRPRCLAR